MEYREIVSVTGLPGLYQLITTKSDGAIVRSVSDKTTKFISARQHNVTPLESIEVYTTGDNVRLHEVFKKMQENEQSVTPIDPKTNDNNAIKAYFKSIFPEFDEERVYVSDMKKMVKWYELLKISDLLHFDEETTAEQGIEDVAATGDATAETAVPEPATEPEAPAAKAAPEAEAAPVKPKRTSKSAAATADGGEKPAKKTVRKKTTEE